MEKYIQFTLTVNAGKWIIAKALSELKYVKDAIANGTLLLYGGTTVSALAEILTNEPLRLCGRITPRGTVTTFNELESTPTTILISKGKKYDYPGDQESKELLRSMGKNDVVITGANGYDIYGNALLMSGGYGLGGRNQLIAPMHTEGAKLIIAVGLEKFIPGSVIEIIKYTGRNLPIWSMGMSVGFIAVIGEIITEIEAVKILTGIEPMVIGRGGINGAEGGSTMIAQGSEESLNKLIKLVEWSLRKKISASIESLQECDRGIQSCYRHLACCYKSGKFFNRIT